MSEERNLSLSEAVTAFLVTLSPEQKQDGQQELNRFVRWYGGERPIREIIAREIEDNPNNYTRFFVLSQRDAPPLGSNKASIVFSVKHEPGALYNSLKELMLRNINLTKIESRPTRQKPWEYNFYLDCEGYQDEDKLKEVLNSLEQTSIFVKLLGSYRKAKE